MLVIGRYVSATGTFASVGVHTVDDPVPRGTRTLRPTAHIHVVHRIHVHQEHHRHDTVDSMLSEYSTFVNRMFQGHRMSNIIFDCLFLLLSSPSSPLPLLVPGHAISIIVDPPSTSMVLATGGSTRLRGPWPTRLFRILISSSFDKSFPPCLFTMVTNCNMKSSLAARPRSAVSESI